MGQGDYIIQLATQENGGFVEPIPCQCANQRSINQNQKQMIRVVKMGNNYYGLDVSMDSPEELIESVDEFASSGNAIVLCTSLFDAASLLGIKE